MTNAEKYKEVFGFEPSYTDCIADRCDECPLGELRNCIDYVSCVDEFKVDWWNSEYKENK